MVGLGVAIDYALLVIVRFRHELRDGKEVETRPGVRIAARPD